MSAANIQKPAYEIGTMYWQNPNDGYAKIFEDMRRIKDNNFSLVRAFIWWEQVECQKGAEYDFKIHDMLFEAAAENGLELMSTLGLYLPFWLRRELGEQGIKDEGRYACFDRPEVYKPMSRYIHTVVKRYKDAKALRIWNVWNEPMKGPCRCRHTQVKFLVWLKNRYKDLDGLKATWLGERSVFETPFPESWESFTVEWLEDVFKYADRGRTSVLEYDFYEFGTANVVDSIQWLIDQVRIVDKDHEVHVNLASPLRNSIGTGLNEWLIAESIDSISVTVHPTQQFALMNKREQYPTYCSFAADKVRSWADGKDAWIGEFQAGTTYSRENSCTPTPDEIRHYLWQALGRGLNGFIFWLWQSWRSSMFEVGEFGLRNASDGGATQRSEAAAEVGKIIREHNDVFKSVHRPASRVAIMCSRGTSIFNMMQHNTRRVAGAMNENAFAIIGCYRALHRANIPVDFVNEDEIQLGCLAKYDILFMPHAQVLSADVASAIKEYVKQGGHVWADGRCGFLDEHIFLRDSVPCHGLSELFGCSEADFITTRGDVPITTSDGRKYHGFRHEQYFHVTTGKVIATFGDGRPAIIRNRYGQGTAELVGSYMTRGLQENEDDATMDYIVSAALCAGVRPALDIRPVVGFEACYLTGDSHDVMVLTNRTQEPLQAEIKSPNKYSQITCPQKIIDNISYAEGKIQLKLGVLDTAVLLCSK